MKNPYPLTPLQLELIHRVINHNPSNKSRGLWDWFYKYYQTDPVENSEFLMGIAKNLLTPELNLKFIPVHPLEFLVGKEYLNKGEDLYPKILPYFVEMNCGDYVEAVLTGAIGTAKSTLAIWTTAYQLYCLSAYINPHRQFELDTASEILFIFQSLNKQLAKEVDFDRFRATLETSPYFREKFPFDKNLLSQLQFPNRISVKPISGESTGALGQNVFGGMLDELNFMEIVEKSKRTHNESEYDQAIALYNNISRRRKSRFMKFGRVPGMFCLVSSKRYPGQFTDLKEEEARKEIRETGRSTIYVYDKRTWDVLPENRFSGRWFKLFIGDMNRKPRILDDGEPIRVDDTELVIDVPVEYKSEFERDPMGSLRDIAGVSTLALFPFFQSREDVAEMFGHHPSILSLEETDFVSPPLMILPKKFWRKHIPRWVHIDLSKTKDCTGITCGCVPGFGAISRGDGADDFEMMPQFHIDFQLRVKAPKGGEILYYKIRSLLYALRDQGLNIKWVSCDSYQSTDMLQILRQNNFVTGEISMDKTTLPYETLKSACYDGRVLAPSHPHCELELVGLEMDPKLKFIDHQPGKSKDVADSLAGTVYGLTMRRETWTSHDIPIVKLPEPIQNAMEKERERMKEAGDYAGMVRQKFEVETEE
jgi:hypothetical protein